MYIMNILYQPFHFFKSMWDQLLNNNLFTRFSQPNKYYVSFKFKCVLVPMSCQHNVIFHNYYLGINVKIYNRYMYAKYVGMMLDCFAGPLSQGKCKIFQQKHIRNGTLIIIYYSI